MSLWKNSKSPKTGQSNKITTCSMEDWYFQTYKWTVEILQSSEAIARHLILRSYLSADLLKLSTAVQALSIFLFYFLTTALPWPWGALKNSWGSTLSLIDGCRTQMVNSQKCCWQILLLLEQVFCLFCLLCFFSVVPLAEALLNVEQSRLG